MTALDAFLSQAASDCVNARATKHVPLSTEFRRVMHLGEPEDQHRMPCSCGWPGSWWTALDKAAEAWKRHAVVHGGGQ